MTLGELIDKLGGKLAQGDGELAIHGVNSAEAASPFELVFAEDASSATAALGSYAAAVVLRAGATTAYPAGKAVVEYAEPKLWFARAAKMLAPVPPATGLHHAAFVAPDATLDAGVMIGPGAVIGSRANIGADTRIEAGAIVGDGVVIGVHCRIYPRVVLYPGTTVGDRVVVHAGAVLGADGFGFVRDPETGEYTQFPQQGTLVIEDDVEIGANTTIDRGALAETRIRRGAKIDNLVHVGHNCDVGEDVILVALTGISGSSSVGKGAVIAGQVGIGDHVHIGPGVILGGQSGVFNGKTVTTAGMKPGTVLFGTPARPLKQVLREQAVLSRLAKRRGKEAGSGE